MVQEKVTKSGITDIHVVHLLRGDASNRNGAVCIQMFVMRGDESAELWDEVGLFGHGDVDEFSEIPGRVAGEFHEEMLDQVTVIERAIDGDGSGGGGGRTLIGGVFDVVG